MNKTDIINTIIDAKNYQSYLEIGVNNPKYNYFLINCKYKECVDPLGKTVRNDFDESLDTLNFIRNYVITYPMTSDEFFRQTPFNKKYDIIFIDGLHLEEQVGRDIINSLKHLNPGGSIVVHDCIPEDYETQLEENISSVGTTWNGSVWKTMPELKKQDIEFFVVDTNDWGCGVIKYKKNPESLYYPDKSELTYNEVFSKEIIRNSILNIVSQEKFINMIDNGEF